MIGAYNDIQDRLYEIDKSWRNNLIFYGIPADSQGKYYRSEAGTLYSTFNEEVIENMMVFIIYLEAISRREVET